jgi:polysaccharide chain length determinant protein (PEP-CTERM system associated)
MMRPREVASPTYSSTPDLNERLDVLRRRWFVAALTALALFGLVAPFLLGLPRLYRASATILVEGPTESVTQAPVYPGQVDARLQAIKQEALSRSRLTEIIERFDLYPQLQRNGSMEGALARLQRDIKIENTSTEQINGQTSTIAFRLTYVATNPQIAADVANALASFYVAQNDQIRSRQASRTTKILRDQLAEAQKRVEAQESRLTGYTKRNMGTLPKQIDANLASLERLNAQLRANAEEQSRLQDRRQGLLERRQTLQDQAAEQQAKPPVDPNSAAGQLDAVRKQMADLRGHVTDKYPDLKELRDRADALERQVAREAKPSSGSQSQARAVIESGLADVNSQLGRLDKENQLLRSSISSYEHRVESTPGREPELQVLTRDYQSAHDQYDALRKRYEDALLTERAETGQKGQEFRILDDAQPPVGPAGPNRFYILVAALIFAIGAGIAAAVAAERLDTSFHSVDELRSFTRVPVLASIPQIRTSSDRWSSYLRSAMYVGATCAVLISLGFVVFHFAQGSDQVAQLLVRFA